jgi:hypothetical protein
MPAYFIPFGFNAPQPVIPAKAGIQKKADWMPDQVRHKNTFQYPAACGGVV